MELHNLCDYKRGSSRYKYTHLRQNFTKLRCATDVYQPMTSQVAVRTILIATVVTLRFAPGNAADQHLAQRTGPVAATTLIYS